MKEIRFLGLNGTHFAMLGLGVVSTTLSMKMTASIVTWHMPLILASTPTNQFSVLISCQHGQTAAVHPT